METRFILQLLTEVLTTFFVMFAGITVYIKFTYAETICKFAFYAILLVLSVAVLIYNIGRVYVLWLF